MRLSDVGRLRAFSAWLRTGRRPAASDVEVKFNPWHDPDNGRFTFVGSGRYYGRGGASSPGGRGQKIPGVEYIDDLSRPPIRSRQEADAWRTEELAKHGHKPGYREAIERRYRQYISQFATRPDNRPNPATHKGPNQPRPVVRSTGPARTRSGLQGGGGSFGGGGAGGGWEGSSSRTPPQTPGIDLRPGSGRPAEPSPSDQWRKISRNGYLYEIDANGRTRRVSGEITENPNQKRSRTTQSRAGGSDRRPTDHGGHYIARRFNGPTEAFNHFAQDANFNTVRYSRLEAQWAQAKRRGKTVRVRIVPVYEGASQRPSYLNIWFSIDGQGESLKIPNEPEETKNADR